MKLVMRVALLLLAAGLAPGSLASYSTTGGAELELQLFGGLAGANDSFSSLLDQNHFKLLERDGDSLLVGARNVVYNLSLSSFREQRRLEWPPSEDDAHMCRVKGKSPDQCQNYIRALKLQAPNMLFVCGTNAYKPRCRTYLVTTNAYELVSETPGEGACPYQENQNVTSLFADGELYSATAAQFSGIDGLIHRHPLRTEQFNPKQLNSQTDPGLIKIPTSHAASPPIHVASLFEPGLDLAPNFVNSFRYGEHVYFLFREIAIEHINCGKTIYSRIARVCINDSGGQSRANRERWTSFVKARLNCSIPGEFPFYFDELQASTGIISTGGQLQRAGGAAPPSGQAKAGSSWPQQMAGRPAPLEPLNDLFYAAFTTPTNSIGGSAVCAFRMADVLAAFEGPFKSQADTQSQWLPVPESRTPQPRPGTCVNDSKRLPDENINFIKENSLMDQAVEAVWSQPLVMMASINFRFTQIAVDPQVETLGVHNAHLMRTDVIFAATDDGRVFKLINTHHLQSPASLEQLTAIPAYFMSSAAALTSAQGAAGQAPAQARPVVRKPLPDVSSSTVVIEELHLFDARTPVVNLLVHYPGGESRAAAKLIVLAAKQLKAIPLSRCERALSCSDCLALSDPYCAWDLGQQSCQALGRGQIGAGGSSTSISSRRYHYQQGGVSWFPPNNNDDEAAGRRNLLLAQHQHQSSAGSNLTLAWWSQCPPDQLTHRPSSVGAPFRSLFSSHLQVPSRYDYASGHHLAHTALVSLLPPAASPLSQPVGSRDQVAAAYQRPQRPQQQVSSECMTFCGGIYTAPSARLSPGSLTEFGTATPSNVVNCADFVQATHLLGHPGSAYLAPGTDVRLAGSHATLDPSSSTSYSSTLYTSENLYYAVIICAVSSLFIGLLFGFVLGRNTRKHTDSSVCSSAFDETNLYMASTGSHHHNTSNNQAPAANLFATHQLRINHPSHLLLQPQAAPHSRF